MVNVPLICMTAVLVTDTVLSTLSLLCAHTWTFSSIEWSMDALLDYYGDAVDLVAVLLARLLVVTLLVLLAGHVGKPKAPPGDGDDGAAYAAVPTEDPEESADPEHELKLQHRRASFKKSSVLVLLFGIITAMSCYTGFKCVKFQYREGSVQCALMIALPLVINIEFYLAKVLVEQVTNAAGHLVPALHGHPLRLGPAKGRRCALCGKRVDGSTYRCRRCDFDACASCFRRGNPRSGEGLLRGDKGVMEEKQVSTVYYFWRALALTRDFWFLVVLAVASLLLNQGAKLLLPRIHGSLLDNVAHFDEDRFSQDVAWMLLLSVVQGLFGGVRNLCVAVIGRKTATVVRNRLFEAIIYQDIAFFDGNDTGQLTSRMTNDANAMVDPMKTLLNTLLANLVTLVGGLVLCFVTSWRLSIVAFTTMGPMMYVTQEYAKWSAGVNKRIWDALARANAIATEAFTNVRTVRAFSTEGTEVGKYRRATAEALRMGIRDAFAGAGAFTFTSYLELFSTVLVLWYGGRLAIRHDRDFTLGKLITFHLYWYMMNTAYRGLNDVIGSLTQAAGAAQRVLVLMDLRPDIDPFSGAQPAVVKGELQLEDVEFHYQMRPDNKVLTGLNLRIKPGTVCALVGRSGGGKSTIIQLLMRFYDPKAGRILLDGEDFKNLNLKWLHDCMGLVAQDAQLFAATVEENIAYGLETYDRDQLIAAAQLANAHDFIMAFEHGYQTHVGERGLRLSGGQKQRIAVARVLLRKPKLLILDEATSALDAESESLVQEAIDHLIQALAGGCTVVVVAHRLSTIMNADTIVVMDKGRVAEQGTHKELLDANGLYRKLVTKQFSGSGSPSGARNSALQTLFSPPGSRPASPASRMPRGTSPVSRLSKFPSSSSIAQEVMGEASDYNGSAQR